MTVPMMAVYAICPCQHSAIYIRKMLPTYVFRRPWVIDGRHTIVIGRAGKKFVPHIVCDGYLGGKR
jgi:hypothetical protein